MNKKTVLFTIAALLLGGSAAAQESILIKNGTVVPVTGKAIPNASVLIQNGKIAKVGAGIGAPSNAKIIDAKGMYIYPGLIAPLTAIGLTGYPGAGSDTNETGQSNPHLDSYDALNPEDETIEVTRIDGVTTVLTAAGTAAIINGRAVVLNLNGDLPKDMLLKRDALLVINTGARSTTGSPSTLMGVISFIREKLNKAKAAAAKKDASAAGESSPADPEMATLAKVLKQELPAMFMTSDEVTIRAALELIDEFNIKGILFAQADILKFVDAIASKKIPVIWGGTTTMPKRWESVDLNFRTAAELSRKGVLFAFNESAGQGSRNVRRQPVPASLSMAYGLPEEDAVKALTINPAKILGVDDKVGSIEEGKIANIVVSTKPIIQLSSKIQTVIINGKIIPMTSVQTRLRDKYEKIVKERMKRK